MSIVTEKNVIIISDTHGFIHPDIAKLVPKFDIAIHAGDVGTKDILAQLNPIEKVFAVAGNNDAHLSNLDSIVEVELPGGKLAMEHGHKYGHYQPSHQSLRQAHFDAKLVVYGHTHKQFCDTSSSPWIVNPGAAGKTRTNGGASCIVLKASSKKPWQLKLLRFVD